MEPYVALALLAGIVAMDTTSGPQLLVSEPIVSCTLLGCLFGDPATGVLMGSLFQLLFLGYLPLGTVRFTDGNMAAVTATGSVLVAERLGLSGPDSHAVSILVVCALGMVAGSTGLHLRSWERDLNGRRSESFHNALLAGTNVAPGVVHLTGLVLAFCKGLVMAAVFIPAGAFLCWAATHLPADIDRAALVVLPVLWGGVCAPGLLLFWFKGERRYLALGTLGGIVWTLLHTVL